MKRRLGSWWSISLDEELKTFKYKVDLLEARANDNVTAADTEVIQPGKKRKSEFDFWLKNVKCKKLEYMQIENELREQGPSKSLKSRIEKEIKEVEELIQQGQFPKGVVLDDHASTIVPLVTTRLVGQSCAEKVETVLGLLKEEGVFAIGVHGMGGVGKTTIVKEIHDHLLLDCDIERKVYWVTASQDCSLEKLQNDIGKAIGLDSSVEDNERKKALLFQQFSKLKNSVLIIDDLWDSYIMEKIGIPVASNGCKVVITTRKLEVCRRMPCQRIIKIAPLDKADSWTLFVEKLEELPRNVEYIAGEIVEECGGLPLALITMGCCMRGITNVREWENALNDLRKPVSRQDLMEVEVFRILKFSFDRLRDDKVQNCFLSCVLFPEDKEIEEDQLVDFWIDEGLLDDMDNHRDRVNKGHAILNRLVNACLLESSGVHGYRMHDLLRDMGIIITRKHPLFIAESGKQLKQLPEEEKWSKDLVKVSLSYNKIEEIQSAMAFMTPNLTVLILYRNPLKEIPDLFCLHMRSLRVLDLSWTFIQWVPESVSGLEHLRVLSLANCCRLIYVPSVAKLTKLRILDLSGCNQLKEAPRGLKKLESVEKLMYIPWDVSDLIGFNEVVQCLTSLSCFGFFIEDRFSEPSNQLELIVKSDKAMQIRGGEYGGDKGRIFVPAILECLVLSENKMNGTSLGDVFQSVGEAKGLKIIDIKHCEGLEYVLDSSGTQQGSSLVCTTQLRDLHLERLYDLRSIAKFRMSQSFSQLRDLHIRSCPKLKVVVPVTCTKQLLFPNLRSIRVECCEEVEKIFESNEATLSFNPILSFPFLNEFTLKDLPKIKVIFPLMKVLHLPILVSIEVESCKEVEKIFETNSICFLPRLRVFYTKGCPKLNTRRLPPKARTSDESCSMMESHSDGYSNSYDDITRWGEFLSL